MPLLELDELLEVDDELELDDVELEDVELEDVEDEELLELEELLVPGSGSLMHAVKLLTASNAEQVLRHSKSARCRGKGMGTMVNLRRRFGCRVKSVRTRLRGSLMPLVGGEWKAAILQQHLEQNLINQRDCCLNLK